VHSWGPILDPPVNKQRPVNWRNWRNRGEHASERHRKAIARILQAATENVRMQENLCNVRDGGSSLAWGCCQLKRSRHFVTDRFGSPTWIRTTIHGSKGRCPTIRRSGNKEEATSRSLAQQVAEANSTRSPSARSASPDSRWLSIGLPRMAFAERAPAAHAQDLPYDLRDSRTCTRPWPSESDS
jgi:hypothetical protein